MNKIRPLDDNSNVSTETNLSVTIQENSAAQNLKATRIGKRVILNLRGTKFDTPLDKFQLVPNSRLDHLRNYLNDNHDKKDLNQICDDYDNKLGEFYFNKDPHVFNMILEYYSGAKMHFDDNLCARYVHEELKYWIIDEYQCFDDCCQFKFLNKLDEITEELERQNQVINGYEYKEDFGKSFFPKIREKLWTTIENPKSSKFAIIYTIFSYFIQLLSLVDIICLSFPQSEQSILVFNIIEYICITWFTFELIFRFVISPSKLKFIKNPFNIIDSISLIPYFVFLGLQTNMIMIRVKNFARILRIVSGVKIFGHFDKLKTLGRTITNSTQEIAVYCCYLGVGILVFSSLLWTVEYDAPDTKYTSIPASFWWAVVTVTTVGYGDVVPATIAGKLFAGICAIMGVLLIGLPTGLLANNFSQEYKYTGYKKKVIETFEKKKQKLEEVFFNEKTKKS